MMAKIRVKLRLSNIEGKAGTIYYCISHRSQVRHISTNIRIMPQLWDGHKQRITGSTGAQKRIDSDMSTLSGIVRRLEAAAAEYTADDIVDSFRTPWLNISVVEFMHEQIQFLTDCNRLGTAVNYRRAADALEAFLAGRELLFQELTPAFVEQYGDHLLRKGLRRNSLSFHMRILRAVYNKAVRHGYAEQSFPFRNVYTGIDRTRKRALGEDTISRLIHLDVAGMKHLSFARDLFMFSFYTRGMAFVDMAYLRKTDIQEGIIRYSRHKTGQQLAVRAEPCIREIIDRYSQAVSDTPYVFPILKSDDTAASFNEYKSHLRIYNYRLKQLAQLLGLECGISSYTSRHSWATTARNHNVPMSVISAAMGHASERTTQIYLATLENSLIDSANREILELLNKPRKC